MDFSQAFGGLITGPRGAVLSVLLGTATPLTGRQIHRLVADQVSLTSVQKELRALAALGVIKSGVIGASGVHVVNDSHAWVPSLRAMVDPLTLLRRVVAEVASDAKAIVVFGSIARGQATGTSDIDLAVIAPDRWDRQYVLQDAVEQSFGNACDVVVLTAERYGAAAEPLVAEIRADGIVVYGELPAAAGP